MILQALNDYYRRKCDDPDPAQHLPSFGLEQKEIPFLLEISVTGELVQLLDTRTPDGNKKIAESFRVPQGMKKTSGVEANLLWDNAEYVLALPDWKKFEAKTKKEGNEEKKKKRKEYEERLPTMHGAFLKRIHDLPTSAQEDAGIRAIARFFENFDVSVLERQSAWKEVVGSNPVMSFRLQGDVDLVCQRPGSGMGFLASTHFAFNVCVGVVSLQHVALKPCPIFAQVMPQPRQIGPALGDIGSITWLRKISS